MTTVETVWVGVCRLDDIPVGTGVCALVDGEQVAVFRLADGAVFAIANLDPYSGAQCLSRGIVGDADGVPKVASPVYKQSFDLRTGVCLDDDGVAVRTYAVRVADGDIQVSRP